MRAAREREIGFWEKTGGRKAARCLLAGIPKPESQGQSGLKEREQRRGISVLQSWAPEEP